MSLPIFQSQNKDMSLLQTNWASQLNPLLSLPLSSSLLLQSITLSSGDNSINHKLGRKLQGWIVSRMIGNFVQLYDKQNTNVISDKTLVLNSSATGMIDLIVF